MRDPSALIGSSPSERRCDARSDVADAWRRMTSAHREAAKGGAPVAVIEALDNALDAIAAASGAVRDWEVERG
jgi:hypothetical protein